MNLDHILHESSIKTVAVVLFQVGHFCVIFVTLHSKNVVSILLHHHHHYHHQPALPHIPATTTTTTSVVLKNTFNSIFMFAYKCREFSIRNVYRLCNTQSEVLKIKLKLFISIVLKTICKLN